MDDTSAFGEDFGDVVESIFEDIVVLVLGEHLGDGLAVDNEVVDEFVVGEGAVVNTDGAEFDVGGGGIERDADGSVLNEVVGGVVDIGFFASAVDIEFEKTAGGAGAYDEGELDIGVGGDFGRVEIAAGNNINKLVILKNLSGLSSVESNGNEVDPTKVKDLAIRKGQSVTLESDSDTVTLERH